MGMGGATEIEMVTLFLSRLVERCCSSGKEKTFELFTLISGVIYKQHTAGVCVDVSGVLTSVQGSETELSVPVQLLQTWWPGAGMEDVVLLVPWSLIVK